MFSRTTCVFALAMALLPLASRAASDTELQELRKELDAMRANYEARLQQLESRLKKAEADAAAVQSAPQAITPSAAPPPTAVVAESARTTHRAPVRLIRRSR